MHQQLVDGENDTLSLSLPPSLSPPLPLSPSLSLPLPPSLTLCLSISPSLSSAAWQLQPIPVH